MFTSAGNGISTFAAQNFGAGRLDRIKKGFRAGILLDVVQVVPLTLAFVFIGRPLIGIFMQDVTGDAMATGMQFLRIVAPFYMVVATKTMSDGILRGSGAVKLFMITTFADLFLRVGLAAVLAPIFGSTGVWMSWPIGWSVGAILSVCLYCSGIWKNAKL